MKTIKIYASYSELEGNLVKDFQIQKALKQLKKDDTILPFINLILKIEQRKQKDFVGYYGLSMGDVSSFKNKNSL